MSGFLCGGYSKAVALQRRQVKIRRKSAVLGGFGLFSLAYAEYFANGRKNIVKATANDDFSVTLEFDNGERRRLDMKPTIAQGGVFKSFNDISDFKRVYIDDANALCWDIDPNVDSEKNWSNKVDISPEFCYVESTPI